MLNQGAISNSYVCLISSGSIGLETSVNLFAVHGHILWGCDAESDLGASYRQHGDGHLVADLHGLTYTSAQDEHGLTSLLPRSCDAGLADEALSLPSSFLNAAVICWCLERGCLPQGMRLDPSLKTQPHPPSSKPAKAMLRIPCATGSVETYARVMSVR